MDSLKITNSLQEKIDIDTVEGKTAAEWKAEAERMKVELRKYSGWSPHQFLGLLAIHRKLGQDYIALDTKMHDYKVLAKMLTKALFKKIEWTKQEYCNNESIDKECEAAITEARKAGIQV